MEDDTSSTKDGTPVWSFNEVVRAILRCLGLEPLLFHKLNPSCPTPNKEDADGKLLINNNVQAAAPCKLESSEEAGSDPPSTSATDNSDPPSTSTSTALTDPPADPAPSTSTTVRYC